MKKRWAISLLLSSSSHASLHVEPRLYLGGELVEGVMAYYSLPWFDVGVGVQSVFDASKDERQVDAEVQFSKAFQLSERWAFSVGFGSLLGEHWLSDYQLRYRVGDFSWLTAGYRYHLEESYDNQNQFYLGYRLSLSDTAEAFNEFMMDSEIYAHGLFGVGDGPQLGLGIGMNFASSPWGLEFNMARSGTESLQSDDGNLGWMALSGTYRWEHFLMDDLTLRGGLGVANVHQERCCQIQEDERNWAFTPDVELSYRLGPYWDVFGGYRFFIGEGAKGALSPNVLTLGVRAYWSRQAQSAPIETTPVVESTPVPKKEVIDSRPQLQMWLFSEKTIDGGFGFDTIKPSDSFVQSLGEVTSVLKAHPQARAVIVGHTDSTGTETYNQTLSEHRAEAVAAQLIDLGVNQEQLELRGEGELSPVADNATAEGRAQNRRVEVTIPNFQFEEQTE